MSRDINEATPFMREFSALLIAKAKSEFNLRVIVTSVARHYKEQMALYAQGRQSLDEVNLLRKVAKMSPITAKENGHKVTWTMASKHIVNLDDAIKDNDLSRAIDFGILDSNGYYQGSTKADVNNDNVSDYKQLGELGEIVGAGRVKWGGRWKSPDMPHFEEMG